MAHTYEAGLVSIVIPVYNVAEYLPECLDSLLEQTYDQLEIVCVNDGSTDDSGRVLDTYASKDARIRVIHKENGGVSLARNTAMQASRGEFITLVDGDDWLEPDTIERCIECTRQHPEVDFIEYGYVDVIEGDRQPFYSHIGSEPYSKRMGEETLIGYVNQALPSPLAGAKFFRSSIVEGISFPLGRFYEDEIFGFKLSMKSNCFLYLAEPLYNYRRNRPNSTTSQGITKRIEQMFQNQVDLIAEMKQLDSEGYLKGKFSHPLATFACTFMLHKAIIYAAKFRSEAPELRGWLEEMLGKYLPEIGKTPYITYGKADELKKKAFLLAPRAYAFVKVDMLSWLYKALNIKQK
ncbi:MAG: glycosyltransferase family 2 protein [Porphyromonadaceae bacterium]|nr:glycosyltransferase family 2 protein [Porphyromonadaceae bacterium]